MKKTIRILALSAALLMGVFALGCGARLPETVANSPKPSWEDRTNLDVTNSSYIRNASLSAKELHINNDYSGWVKYVYTGSSNTLRENMDKLLVTLNKLRYSEKQYTEKGYRLFYMEEGDVDETSETRWVTIRFSNLTWCHESYYKVQTLEEYLKSSGTADMNYHFKDFKNPDKDYSAVGASDKDKKKLKIWQLQNLADGVKITIEGAFRYFYDDGNKTIEQKDGGIVFQTDSKAYFIYTDNHPVDVTVLVVGIVAGLAVAAAIVVVAVTLRRRKTH